MKAIFCQRSVNVELTACSTRGNLSDRNVENPTERESSKRKSGFSRKERDDTRIEVGLKRFGRGPTWASKVHSSASATHAPRLLYQRGRSFTCTHQHRSVSFGDDVACASASVSSVVKYLTVAISSFFPFFFPLFFHHPFFSSFIPLQSQLLVYLIN